MDKVKNVSCSSTPSLGNKRQKNHHDSMQPEKSQPTPCIWSLVLTWQALMYSGRSTFHLPFVCSCRSHNLGSLCGPFAHDCSRVLTRARSNTSLLKQPNNYAPRCYFDPPYFRTLTREHSFPAESHTYGQKTKAHQYWVFQSLRTMLSQSSIQPLTAYSRKIDSKSR